MKRRKVGHFVSFSHAWHLLGSIVVCTVVGEGACFLHAAVLTLIYETVLISLQRLHNGLLCNVSPIIACVIHAHINVSHVIENLTNDLFYQSVILACGTSFSVSLIMDVSF